MTTQQQPFGFSTTSFRGVNAVLHDTKLGFPQLVSEFGTNFQYTDGTYTVMPAFIEELLNETLSKMDIPDRTKINVELLRDAMYFVTWARLSLRGTPGYYEYEYISGKELPVIFGDLTQSLPPHGRLDQGSRCYTFEFCPKWVNLISNNISYYRGRLNKLIRAMIEDKVQFPSTPYDKSRFNYLLNSHVTDSVTIEQEIKMSPDGKTVLDHKDKTVKVTVGKITEEFPIIDCLKIKVPEAAPEMNWSTFLLFCWQIQPKEKEVKEALYCQVPNYYTICRTKGRLLVIAKDFVTWYIGAMNPTSQKAYEPKIMQQHNKESVPARPKMKQNKTRTPKQNTTAQQPQQATEVVVKQQKRGPDAASYASNRLGPDLFSSRPKLTSFIFRNERKFADVHFKTNTVKLDLNYMSFKLY